MEGLKVLKSTQIIILGICFAVATIASTMILTKGILQLKKMSQEVISVTGSAEKKITSDFIVWSASFSVREAQLKSAYNRLQQDLEKVKKYILAKGIKESELFVLPVSTAKIFKKDSKGNATNEIESYELSQGMRIESNDVKKVDELSRSSTALIEEGVQFMSDTPQYFYTKLAELKIQMLSEASEDAKKRAESMAKSTGNKVGVIRSAKMGVFQITPATSTDVSWYGENDTSSLEKKVMAVVSAAFSIE
ncbi:MAG: SIMPL domain-containing protein [Candidatus Omnitrophica bacterium]|nr:SIMPL domain-containing protein [Candidatus Omnitrophota bacterium]